MQSNEPGVIVHTPQPTRRRSSRVNRSTSAAAAASGKGVIGGRRSTLTAPANATGADDGFDLDRLSYMSTALAALPGMSLRKFFVPVMRLYKQQLAARRATRERFADGYPIDMASRAMEKMVQDGMHNLAKALTEASREVGAADGGTLSVDPKALGVLLHGKVEPVSLLADHVLTYPSESPESQFVYIVLNGAMTVTHYQPQSRPGAGGVGGGADGRTQFFTSSDEKLLLCGGGVNVDGNNLFLAAAQAHEARQSGNNNINNNTVNTTLNDTASNMTSAIQRSLRNASRAVGQPTLVASRYETLRAPTVLGAAEALGLAPSRCASVIAATTSTGKGEVTQYVPYVDALRIRLLDVHAALLELCEVAAPPSTSTTGGGAARASVRLPEAAGNALVLAAARSKCLTTYFYQNEILMRQSWLLQDTPTAAIRTLISLLRPHTHMPGEVLACPHRHGTADRQLCFLRRGRVSVVEVASNGTTTTNNNGTTTGTHHTASCACTAALATARTVGVAEAGTSFGELSLLFGEPRRLTLVADTACDVWCLSYADFAVCMRRDDALRRSLVDKAAALRMSWLGEQRFTTALAQRLRASCELFRPLSDFVIRLIQERLEPVVYSAGSIVASTSEKCDGLIMIIHGRVVSIIDGVSAYGPGDVIGEGCLVSHRWPLGLSARTMVEGWKLKSEALQEALVRADMLHAHSGETTSMTPLWLKRIFTPPLPDVETDVVGRQRMPTVGPAPGGEGYPRYARIMSEIFLKALCFRYRDYVKWDEISYDTLGGPYGVTSQSVSDQLSRELVMTQMQATLASARGVPRPATAPLASRLPTSPAPPASGRAAGGGARARRRVVTDAAASSMPRPRRGTLQDGHALQDAQTDGATASSAAAAGGQAAGAGMDAVKKVRRHTTGASRSATPPSRARRSGKRRQVAGASAFLVDRDVIAEPFRAREGVLMAVSRGSAPTAPAARSAAAKSAPLPDPSEPLPANVLAAPEGLMSAAAAARWETTLRHMQQAPPQLDAFASVLDERDRLYATEQQHELTADQQQAQREAQVRERLQNLKANSAAVLASSGGVDASANTRATRAPAPPLPPVHLFLSDPENPRAELTVAEAIAIGYVLQLPSKDHIQSSVSVVDPDVTLGLPTHRARRRAMALTPNDRHNRRNFLFASASFTEASESVSRYHQRKGLEQERQAKARRLLDMLQAAETPTSRQQRGRGAAKGARPAPRSSDSTLGGEAGDGDEAPAAPRSGLSPLRLDAEPLAVAPAQAANALDAADRETSPTVALSTQISAGFFMSPERDHASGGSTPSPFRGSPGKAAQKREEGYLRLLGRDPLKAMDMLYQRYHLTWAPLPDSSPLARGTAPPAPSSSAASRSLTERLMTATQPTAEPMPGLNFDQPELIFASGRDRRTCAAYLSVHASSGGAVGADLVSAASPVSATPPRTPSGMRLATPTSLTAGAAAAAVETATCAIDALVHAPEAALFVDGYGTLKPEPSSVRHHTLLTLPLDPFVVPLAQNFGQRRSTVGASAGAAGAAARSPGASLFSQVPLRPQDLVMPDVEEAGQFMRRMQRDVVGLNAIAEEQAKARERQRQQEPRLARRAERVEAVLSTPTLEEDQVVQDWRTAYYLQTRDPLALVRVPDALLPQAGPNYLAQEMARMQHQTGASGSGEGPAATAAAKAHANVVAWQDQVSGPSVSAYNGHPLNANGSGRRASASARRVVAAIGTKQLGYDATPLVSPAQNLSDTDYQAWLAQREQLFAAYAQQQKHPGLVEDAVMLATPGAFMQPAAMPAAS